VAGDEDHRSGSVRANGIDLFYRCHDRGLPASAPWIVLIRGLGTQLIEWSPVLLEGLTAAGLRVLTFDNRDVGLSGKATDDYRLADMAADTVGLLDALGIDRAHLFGISLGGMVAQLMACHYPQRVGCLFSVMSSSGDPSLPQAAPEIRARMLAGAHDREAIVRLNAENRAVFGSPDYPEPESLRLQAAAAAYDRCYHPAGVARQFKAAMSDGSRVERLERITAPTLVIHGVDDPLIPMAAGEDTARHVPGAELLLIPGMGHNIPDGLAPRLVAAVTGFIGRRSGQ
jgi:pimeloyl-ACP methyl ester carboxylesterase